MFAVCVPISSTDRCHQVNQGSSARVTVLVMSPNSYLKEKKKDKKMPQSSMRRLFMLDAHGLPDPGS